MFVTSRHQFVAKQNRLYRINHEGGLPELSALDFCTMSRLEITHMSNVSWGSSINLQGIKCCMKASQLSLLGDQNNKCIVFHVLHLF